MVAPANTSRKFTTGPEKTPMETLLSKHRFKKIVRFSVSGVSGAVVHFLILISLVEIGNLPTVLATTIAFLSAATVSFTMQKVWTFKNYDQKRTPVQAGVYIAIGACNIVINAFLMYLLVNRLLFSYLPSQIVTSSIIAIESYFLYHYVVFRQRHQP